MRRCLFLLGALVALTSCEPYDAIHTWVTHDTETDRLRVHSRINNVTTDFFECQTPEICTDAVLGLLRGSGTSKGAKGVWQLKTQGADDLRVSLESKGASLDVLIWYETWPGTQAAQRTGVRLEMVSRGRKAPKPQLVVAWEEKRHIEAPGRVETRISWRPQAGEDAAPGAMFVQQEWVLPKGQNSVQVVEKGNYDNRNVSLFEEVPGLREALVAKGVL